MDFGSRNWLLWLNYENTCGRDAQYKISALIQIFHHFEIRAQVNIVTCEYHDICYIWILYRFSKKKKKIHVSIYSICIETNCITTIFIILRDSYQYTALLWMTCTNTDSFAFYSLFKIIMWWNPKTAERTKFNSVVIVTQLKKITKHEYP